MATFQKELLKTSNTPVTIVHMEPTQRLIAEWTNTAGTIYKISVEHFVINCLEASTPLTQATSASVSSDEWYFNPGTKELYVDVGEDPSGVFLSVKYRLFYSSYPMDLPFDLATGTEVHYTSLLKSTSAFTDQIDPDDLVGIALAGSGSLNFHNDGSWKSIYSKLFFETSAVKIYLGFNNIAVGDFKLIYKGFVDAKTYSEDQVTFRTKDFIEKLRNEVPLQLFTSSDGAITSEGKSKRRIYGRAKVLGVSLEKIKDGYPLTGTFTKTGDKVITGVGSTLLAEATPEDTILFTNLLGDEVNYSIDSVDSNTQITLSEAIDSFTPATGLRIKPEINPPYRNREYFICDHVMREPTSTVVSGSGFRTLVVDVNTDLEGGDPVKINGQNSKLGTVSENGVLILETNLNFVPSVGQLVVKQPVSNVWYGSKPLVLDRDYTVTNASPSKLVISELAEFNIKNPQPIASLVYTNGSRDITGDIAFKDFFKPWDWIRSDDVTHTTWYQVLEVKEESLVLRAPYDGSTRTSVGERKNIDIISDDSRILIEANGITKDGVKTGAWVKTGPEVVEHLLLEQELDIDATTFASASLEAGYLVSLTVPLAGNSSRPKVKNVIDQVNRSILGSLHENAVRDIVYNVLSPSKGAITEIIRDDDLLGYKIESTGKNVAQKVISKYRHEDADIFTGEIDSDVIEVTNTVVANLSDILREEKTDLYLWDQASASTMSERISLLREVSNTIIKMKSNTRFLNSSINELIYLELRETFERFGTEADKNFIGIINLLSKKEGETEIEVTDLGGFYNKIANYTASGAPSYGASEIVDRSSDGYYTNTNGIVGNSSVSYRMNLYG